MNILVTGATGFIGQHLIGELSKNRHHIWCLVRETSDKIKVDKLHNLGIKIVTGDITSIDKDKLPKDIDWIFHMAALVDVVNEYSLEPLVRQNVDATIRLAKIYNNSIKKFIFLSSMAAIGIRDEDRLINEQTPCRPDSNYGRSKLKAEKELLKLYRNEKFPVVILRPPTVYGPGEHYNFLKISRAIYHRKFLLIGKGDNLLNWCYVGNLVEAMILAANSKDSAGNVFLINDERPYSLKEIVTEIAKAEGRKIPNFYLPIFLANVAGVFFGTLGDIFKFESPISPGRVKTLTSNFAYDIKKAQKVLGYEPKTILSKSVGETIKSYLQEGLLDK